MTLDDMLRDAVETDGLCSLDVVVAQYDRDFVQALSWQAIARYRGYEKGPWGVGVSADPAEAVAVALHRGAGEMRRLSGETAATGEDIFG